MRKTMIPSDETLVTRALKSLYANRDELQKPLRWWELAGMRIDLV